MRKRFNLWVKASILLVYLVIATGGVVRMTGSGMGCPDWPKCFGYYVPPMNIADLTWMSQKIFKKGQMIIYNDELKVSKKDFISGSSFNTQNWEGYTKHDYSKFKPLHTWVEFINRLIGVICGISVLILGFYSLQFVKNKPILTFLSLLTIIAVGFQAWLGKTVVDSNLAPYRISLHMAMALLIVLGLIFLLYSTGKKVFSISGNSFLKIWACFAVGLTLFQIGLGTQVRQFVDLQTHQPAGQWLDPPPVKFYVHRSLSLLVLGVHIIIFLKLRKMRRNVRVFNQILGLIGLEIFTGILMFYFDFPYSSQPLHLIIAALLFGVQSFFILQLMINKKSYDI